MSTITLHDTSQAALSAKASTLAPGSDINVPLQKPDDLPDVKTRLILAGFVDIIEHSPVSLKARLPSYTRGASVSLSRAPISQSEADWATALSKNSLAVDTVDEAALLSADGVPAGSGDAACLPAGTAASGVSSKRQPCANCSCGLADTLAAEEKGATPAVLAPSTEDAEKSACGSCSLGDAFRCASCPYLGLPPFKPGEKVAVPSSFMTSDI